MKVTSSARLLSIPKFAACFGVSDYYVRNMVNSGTIRQVNIPGVLSRHPRFTIEELIRFKEMSGLSPTAAYWEAIKEPEPQHVTVEPVEKINGIEVPKEALVLIECPQCVSGIRWKCVRAGNTFDQDDSIVGVGVTMHDAWQSLLVQEQKEHTKDKFDHLESKSRQLQTAQ